MFPSVPKQKSETYSNDEPDAQGRDLPSSLPEAMTVGSGEPLFGDPAKNVPSPPRKWGVGLAVVALLALLSLGVLFANRSPGPTDQAPDNAHRNDGTTPVDPTRR